MKQRLESLDVLRGADLFFLMAVGPIVRRFIKLLTSLGSTTAIGSSTTWRGRDSLRGIS